MKRADIDRLLELEEKATKGPWCVDDSRPEELLLLPDECQWAADFPTTGVDCLPDVRLIAEARNALPSILAELRAARKCVEAARPLDDYSCQLDRALSAYDALFGEAGGNG